MADRPAGETVFCHECRNRWPREDGGLTCPSCQSEFVEILEEEPEQDGTPDPRRERSPAGFPDFLPGLLRPLVHGHEQYMDGNVTHHQYRSNDGRFSYTATTYRSPVHTSRPQQPSLASPTGREFHEPADPFGPALRNFSTIFQGIANGGELPRHGRHYHHPSSPGFGRAGDMDEPHAHHPGPDRPMNYPPFDTIFHDFHNMRAQQGQQGNGDGAPTPGTIPAGAHPIAAILAQLFGMTHNGDAVYSQEEFDRVMSQLMAQNNATAPGPASEEAIQSLAKKKIDSTMLGDDGKAECSICMDRVDLGNEVTVLPCEHWFHETCVKSWLSEHDTCPHCRRGISEPQPSSGENQPEHSGANTSAPGSRANPFVVHDDPPHSSPASGHPGSADDGAQSQSPRHSRGLSGWMRNHFGGSSGPGGSSS